MVLDGHVRFAGFHDDSTHVDLAIRHEVLVAHHVDRSTGGGATADRLSWQTWGTEGSLRDAADLVLPILRSSTVVGTTRFRFLALGTLDQSVMSDRETEARDAGSQGRTGQRRVTSRGERAIRLSTHRLPGSDLEAATRRSTASHASRGSLAARGQSAGGTRLRG